MSGGGARSGNGRDKRSGKREEPRTRGGGDVRSWEREKVSAVLYPSLKALSSLKLTFGG